jgi:hypothetical protein
MTADEYEANKKFYLLAWTEALKGLLHWPDDRIANWVRERAIELNNPKSLLMTEVPIYKVIWEAVPAALKERLQGPELTRLGRALESAILKGNFHWDQDPTFDWIGARQRANEVLNQFGESLPE